MGDGPFGQSGCVGDVEWWGQQAEYAEVLLPIVSLVKLRVLGQKVLEDLLTRGYLAEVFVSLPTRTSCQIMEPLDGGESSDRDLLKTHW